MTRSTSQWQKCKLPDVYWFQEGPGVRQWQFTRQGIKLLNVANITTSGTIDLGKTNRYLSVEEVESKYTHFLVDEGDLVIASSGISFDSDGFLRTRGAFVKKEHLPLCMNTSTIRFKRKENISDLRFLKYWLDSLEFRTQVSRFVTGSAQQNFGPSHLKEVTITLPPLPEQQCIAALLDRADRLRRMRRYAEEMSASFLQSVFVQMFGDITRFDLFKFEELLLEEPKNGLYLPSEKYGQGTPIIRIDAFYDGLLGDPRYFKRVKATLKEIEEFGVQDGDILINRVNSMDYLGKCALVKGLSESTLFESNMIRVRIDKRVVLPIYLTTFLSSGRARTQLLVNAKKAVNQASVNQTDIKSLNVPLPPLGLQQKFARIVQQHERLRTQQREAARQAEHLFQTLLHRAFRGEL